MNRINILYQSSEAYAIPAAVSICSLLENNKSLDEIDIYFIDAGLTEEDRERITELVERYQRGIHFLSATKTEQMLRKAGVELWSGSYATFYKIFTCCSLNDIDRILYIDADTMILDSLKELCNYDMEGYASAMASSGMTDSLKNPLGMEDYFNAGVIYFNLKYWRENNLGQLYLDVINSKDCARYTIVGDETLNNYVMRGNIKKLPLKYNFESSWYWWGWNQKLYHKLGFEQGKDCYYSQSEIKEAKEKPVIAHYVDLTTGRPWDYCNDNPFREEFELYLKLVQPWKKIDFAMRGIGGNNRGIAIGKYFIKKIMPMSIRSRIAFKQHDTFWANQVRALDSIG